MYLFLATWLFQACTKSETTPDDKAQQVIDKAIEVHGGKSKYANLEMNYVFRDKSYYLKQSADGKYEYWRSFEEEGQSVKDVLTNEGLIRYVNNEAIELPDTTANKYANSVNSVHYFTLLPYRLNDPAVKKQYEGVVTIKDQPYHAVQVTFQEEGGGEDFEDLFFYWFHEDNGTMDYLAYSYETDGGGVRFRSVSEVEKVGGIRFQDYINYKAPIGTPLADLLTLYEANQLEELSRIELEQIEVVND